MRVGVLSTTPSVVRGVCSATGPDSSFGGVPVGYWPDDGHKEEEIQLGVQVEEEEIRETHGKKQKEEQRVEEHTTLKRTTWMSMWKT